MERFPKVVVVFQFSGSRPQLEAALKQFAETRRAAAEAEVGSAVEMRAKIFRRTDGIYEFYPKLFGPALPSDPEAFAADLRSRAMAAIVSHGGVIL